jgi:tRNA (mo5U34)-methyltransferase
LKSDISWYHTIELPDGSVTPGLSDTRSALARIPFPASLEGKRCLDIGTADGFWAFTMEKRGAREVIAVDVDDPTRRDWPWSTKPDPNAEGRRTAFMTAREALGSSVTREDLSIYEISPERLGRFDFAFIGDLLLHLRDPVRAMAAVATVLDGELLLNEAISLGLTVLHPSRPTAHFAGKSLPRWWVANATGLRAMVTSAGYEVVDSGRPFFAKFGPGHSTAKTLVRSFGKSGPRVGMHQVGRRLFGIPHVWVRAKPRKP